MFCDDILYEIIDNCSNISTYNSLIRCNKVTKEIGKKLYLSKWKKFMKFKEAYDGYWKRYYFFHIESKIIAYHQSSMDMESFNETSPYTSQISKNIDHYFESSYDETKNMINVVYILKNLHELPLLEKELSNNLPGEDEKICIIFKYDDDKLLNTSVSTLTYENIIINNKVALKIKNEIEKIYRSKDFSFFKN